MDKYKVNSEIKANYLEYAKRLQDIKDKQEIDLEDKNIKKLQNRMMNIEDLKSQLDIKIQDVYKKRNDMYENLITAVIGARYLTTIEDDLSNYENSDKIIKSLDITLKTSELNEILNAMVIVLTSIKTKSTQTKKDLISKYENELFKINNYLKTLNLIKYSNKTVADKFDELFVLLDNEDSNSYSNAIIKVGEIRAFILNDIFENEKNKIEKLAEIIKAVDSFIFIYQEREANDNNFNSDFSDDLFNNFSDIKSNIEILTSEVDEDIESYRDSFYLNLKESVIKTEEEISNVLLAITSELIKYHDNLENYCLLIKSDTEYITQFSEILNQTVLSITKINGEDSTSSNLTDFMNEQISNWNATHSDKQINLLNNKETSQYLNYGNIRDYNIYKTELKEYLYDSELSYGTIYICNELGIKNNNIKNVNNYLIYLLNKIFTSAFKKKLFTYQNETNIFEVQKELISKNVILNEFPEYEIISSVILKLIPDLKFMNNLDIKSFLIGTEFIEESNIIIKNIELSLIKYLFTEPINYKNKISELNIIFSRIERSFKILLIEYAYENIKKMINEDDINFNTDNILETINTYRNVWLGLYYANSNILLSYLGTNKENTGLLDFLKNDESIIFKPNTTNNFEEYIESIKKDISDFIKNFKDIWGIE